MSSNIVLSCGDLLQKDEHRPQMLAEVFEVKKAYGVFAPWNCVDPKERVFLMCMRWAFEIFLSESRTSVATQTSVILCFENWQRHCKPCCILWYSRDSRCQLHNRVCVSDIFWILSLKRRVRRDTALLLDYSRLKEESDLPVQIIKSLSSCFHCRASLEVVYGPFAETWEWSQPSFSNQYQRLWENGQLLDREEQNVPKLFSWKSNIEEYCVWNSSNPAIPLLLHYF